MVCGDLRPWAARAPRSPSPRRDRRGHVRPVPGGYAANVEAVATVVPDPSTFATPRRPMSTTPRTPRRSTPWSPFANERRRGGPGVDRRRHAEERRRSPWPTRRGREVVVIEHPGRPRRRRQAARGRGRAGQVETAGDADFARTPSWSGVHRPRVPIRTAPYGADVLPPGRRASWPAPLDHRCPNVEAGTCSTRRRRDFAADGVDRGGRGPRGRPGAGRLRAAGNPRPRHRDRSHLRPRSTSTRRRSAYGAGRARHLDGRDDGLAYGRSTCPAWSRRWPSERRASGSPGRRTSRRRTSTSWRPARTRPSSRPPRRLAAEELGDAPVIDVLYDDRPAQSRPG